MSPVQEPGGRTGASEAGYDELSYEDLVGLLEGLIEQMASGEIGIEEATDLYERASEIHAVAAARLEQIRDRVERLAPPAPPPER